MNSDAPMMKVTKLNDTGDEYRCSDDESHEIKQYRW